MLDDLFVPDPQSGDSSNQIANTRFVGNAVASSAIGTSFAGLSVLGNASTGTAAPAAIVAGTANALLVSNAALTTVFWATLSNFLDSAVGSTNGAVLSRNAATWIALPPVWTAYTPSLASSAGTITSLGTRAGRFTQIGKTVFVAIDVAITTNGTAAGFLIVGLPATSQGIVALSGRENNTTGKMVYGVSPAASITAVLNYYDNTYPGTNGGRYVFGGSYEVP